MTSTPDINKFISGFNLEKPYENYHIGQIKNEILKIFVSEATQMVDKNWKYNNKYTNFKETYIGSTGNDIKHSKEQLTQPIVYITNIIKMLTDKNATEWDGNMVRDTNESTFSNTCSYWRPKTCPELCPKTCNSSYPELCHNSYPNYNLTETREKATLTKTYSGSVPEILLKHDKVNHSHAECTFNYNLTYKNLLESSLKNAGTFMSMTCELNVNSVFTLKCTQLYYLILEHIQLMTYTYIDDKVCKADRADKGTIFNNTVDKQYLSINFPEVSSDVLNMFNDKFGTNDDGVSLNNLKNLKRNQQLIDELFCDVVVYGYTIEKLKLKKGQNEDKHRKIFSKVTRSIIVYGCMKEKISKLEDHNSNRNDHDIVENIKTKIKILTTKPYGVVGTSINNILLEKLNNTNIRTAKLTKVNLMWENSDECFSFILKHMISQVNSENMLQKLTDKSNKINATGSTHTDTVARISNLANEIKQSKEYFVVLFSHLIAIVGKETSS